MCSRTVANHVSQDKPPSWSQYAKRLGEEILTRMKVEGAFEGSNNVA